jgi:hypothetical protein
MLWIEVPLILITMSSAVALAEDNLIECEHGQNPSGNHVEKIDAASEENISKDENHVSLSAPMLMEVRSYFSDAPIRVKAKKNSDGLSRNMDCCGS